MAYEGLQAIKAELGAEVNNQEAKDAQIESAMRAYAQQGYGLVLGHGFEYNAPGVKLAKEYPKTVFVSSSGGETAVNAGAFRFAMEEGFYLAGFLAGKLTKSGTVAAIGGPEVPSIKSTFKAFEAGAKAARPDIKVLQPFTGQNSDIAAAKQATLAAIGQGADMVIHQANAGAQGVFDACKEKKVMAFGANLNQNGNESGVVMASAVILAKPAFVALARRVKDGNYKGEVLTMPMKSGAIDFVMNPKHMGHVPPEVRKAVEDTRQKILNGDVIVPMDKF
jgi:basic membrane lipoprotein Med (substrate-binding protein (PBP1-ABC) superfamily)